jgi:hypothetical protein
MFVIIVVFTHPFVHVCVRAWSLRVLLFACVSALCTFSSSSRETEHLPN